MLPACPALHRLHQPQEHIGLPYLPHVQWLRARVLLHHKELVPDPATLHSPTDQQCRVPWLAQARTLCCSVHSPGPQLLDSTEQQQHGPREALQTLCHCTLGGFWTGNWHPQEESPHQQHWAHQSLQSIPIPAARHVLQLEPSTSSGLESHLQLQAFQTTHC